MSVETWSKYWNKNEKVDNVGSGLDYIFHGAWVDIRLPKGAGTFRYIYTYHSATSTNVSRINKTFLKANKGSWFWGKRKNSENEQQRLKTLDSLILTVCLLGGIVGFRDQKKEIRFSRFVYSSTFRSMLKVESPALSYGLGVGKHVLRTEDYKGRTRNELKKCNRLETEHFKAVKEIKHT